MKSQKLFLIVFFSAALHSAASFAQSSQWYFGSGLGAQQWRGPLNAITGVGGELVVGKQLSRHGGLALSLGFASLPFQQSGENNGVQFLRANREANLFHGDFLVELHPLGRNSFSPFLHVGSGVLNVQVGSSSRKNYISGIFGGGLRLQLSRDLALNLSGNYHHLVGQELEGFSANKNPDGYLAARVGFTFSARNGEEDTNEPWFSTSDTELSPFTEQPKEISVPATTAAQQDSSVAEDEGSFLDEEQEEEEEKAEASEPEPVASEMTTMPALAEEQTAPAPAPAVAEETPASSDPFSNFNRKLDLLDRKANEEAPESGDAQASPLGDEPKFEEFYPPTKSKAATNLREKLFAEDAPEEEVDAEVEAEPTVTTNPDFEARLSRLDEQEDFLSPQTKIADAPEALPEIQREVTQVEHESIAPLTNGKAHNEFEAEAKPASTPANLDWLTQPEPQPNTTMSTPSAQRTESYSPTPEAAAPLRNKAQEKPPMRKTEQADQELLELRAILDKLDKGGASRLEQRPSSDNALAMYSDPEVAELHLRLDAMAGEEIALNKATQEYEAFKDRLGLGEEVAPKNDSEEWNREGLKSQLTTLDNELAQKEEDLNAIRTALAQATAGGAALPMRTMVTRGSFAQGYESALNSFYMQRYDEAIEKFSQLLAEYPTHTLTSNCYYWLGEAQYGFGDYVTALVSFNRVLTFQRSLKKDNALLMLGKTYLALQRPLDARAMFNRLLSEYPASDAVAKAQELIKGM